LGEIFIRLGTSKCEQFGGTRDGAEEKQPGAQSTKIPVPSGTLRAVRVGSIVGNSSDQVQEVSANQREPQDESARMDEPLALQNTVERICFQVLDNVGGTRWPANLDAVDFGRGAQAKVYTGAE
jgi:hypothetical protein